MQKKEFLLQNIEALKKISITGNELEDIKNKYISNSLKYLENAIDENDTVCPVCGYDHQSSILELYKQKEKLFREYPDILTLTELSKMLGISTKLAARLIKDGKEEEVNINSINLMTNVGEEKYGASTFAKEYFKMKDSRNPAYVNAAGTIDAPNDTKGSIISVFRQKVNIFIGFFHFSGMIIDSNPKVYH